MRRRDFVAFAVGGVASAWPLTALSQRSAQIRQVGFLYPGPQMGAPPRVASFMSGLQSGGLPAEQVTIVLRVTGGDAALLGPMAADLVAGKVDLYLRLAQRQFEPLAEPPLTFQLSRAISRVIL
jgi:hypothetical protein